MKKHILLLWAILGLLVGDARAGYVLGTSNPPGTPLTAAAGATSGPMLLNIASDAPSQAIMAAWNVRLEIIADPGATGTLTFALPATGTPPPPPGYIFGANGLGISATNAGTQLTANDFYDPAAGPGASASMANLLQLEYLASQDASGLFGIYAVEGAANTQWTDGSLTTQFFTNVPDGSNAVRIGDVLINSAVVPEPASLTMLGLGLATLAVVRLRPNGRPRPSARPGS